MTTYNSYEAAKIANPEMEVYKLSNGFIATNEPQGVSVHKCNPADHCVTIEKFLADGNKFVEGDVVFTLMDRKVHTIDDAVAYRWNVSNKRDNECFILRAAALETKEPKRTKVEYVKVDNVIFDLEEDYDDRKLFYRAPGVKSLLSVDGDDILFKKYQEDNLYRRIETPIEWWEDASEFINQTDDDNCSSIMEGKLHVNATLTQDQWCDFARILLEQGE